MITRKQFLDGKATFQEYYLDVARACGLSLKGQTILGQAKAALAKGDVHLNTIPLAEWDSLAHLISRTLYRRLAKAMKARGDTVTTAGWVCLLKAVAIKEAQ